MNQKKLEEKIKEIIGKNAGIADYVTKSSDKITFDEAVNQLLSLFDEYKLEVREEGIMQGYKNVRSWFKDFNYPALDVESKRCGVCGGKLAPIRGRYPDTPKRKACLTCAVEIIESIVDNLSSNIEGASTQKKDT